MPGKIDIGKLTLGICGPRNIVIFPVKIVEVHLAVLVSKARNIDDSPFFTGLDLVKE